MVEENTDICPKCGGKLVFYDAVPRVVKEEYGRKTVIKIKRKRCLTCGAYHRVMADIYPYKLYRRRIIVGILSGAISREERMYEDYPCDLTVMRWCASITHAIMKSKVRSPEQGI